MSLLHRMTFFLASAALTNFFRTVEGSEHITKQLKAHDSKDKKMYPSDAFSSKTDGLLVGCLGEESTNLMPSKSLVPPETGAGWIGRAFTKAGYAFRLCRDGMRCDITYGPTCHKYHLSGNGVSWRNHEMMGAISAKTRFSDVAKRALDAWGEKKNDDPSMIRWILPSFRLPAEEASLKKFVELHTGYSWILKANSFGGRHSEWFSDSASLNSYLRVHESSIADEKIEYVMQRFVSNPLILRTFGGKKFSLRQYVLLTNDSPLIAWMSPTFAHCPLASEVFQEGPAHFANGCMQIENQLYQKGHHCPHYTSADVSRKSKWSFRHDVPDVPGASLISAVARERGADQAELLWTRVKRTVALALLSAEPETQRNSDGDAAHDNERGYNILGFDIIVDNNLEVTMLELNSFPGMGFLPVKEDLFEEASRMMRPFSAEELFGSDEDQTSRRSLCRNKNYALSEAKCMRLLAEFDAMRSRSKVLEPILPEISPNSPNNVMYIKALDLLASAGFLGPAQLRRAGLLLRYASRASPSDKRVGQYSSLSTAPPQYSVPRRRYVYCAEGQDKSVRCLPEFILAGIYKCGTSTLAHHIFRGGAVSFWHLFLTRYHDQNIMKKFQGGGGEDMFFEKANIHIPEHAKKVWAFERGNNGRRPQKNRTLSRRLSWQQAISKHISAKEKDDKGFLSSPYFKALPELHEGAPQVIGHYRPALFSSIDSAIRIRSFLPNWRTMKIIICLRNPVEAKQSGYWFNQRNKHKDRTIATSQKADFASWVEKSLSLDSVQAFSRCHIQYGNQSASLAYRECGDLNTPKERHDICSFMYHVGLRAWDEVFESERWRWFFIEIDEFRTEQEKHLSALSGFLGIDHIMKEIQAASRRGVARNSSTMPTFKLNSGSYPMMAQATRRLLANFYRPHNRILENWIGRAFETWD